MQLLSCVCRLSSDVEVLNLDYDLDGLFPKISTAVGNVRDVDDSLETAETFLWETMYESAWNIREIEGRTQAAKIRRSTRRICYVHAGRELDNSFFFFFHIFVDRSPL